MFDQKSFVVGRVILTSDNYHGINKKKKKIQKGKNVIFYEALLQRV